MTFFSGTENNSFEIHIYEWASLYYEHTTAWGYGNPKATLHRLFSFIWGFSLLFYKTAEKDRKEDEEWDQDVMRAKLHICDNSGSLCVITTCTTHCAMAPIYHRNFCSDLFSKSTHTNELSARSVMLIQTEGGHVRSINHKRCCYYGNRNCHNIDLQIT